MVINIHILTAIDITVVLYFFLLLFKFLYASTPPVLNILLTILGTLNLFLFIFIPPEFFKISIGLTLLALFAEINADKYIVTNPSITEIMIAVIFTENIIPSIPSNRYSPKTAPTIFKSTNIAKIPERIPTGTPYYP